MKAGSVLSGKYRLISILGQGGMGSVWRAEHLALRAPVAVKLLAPALEAQPETWARFHREAQSAANLRSPHVVQILDHGVDQDTQTPFIAMELMEGESLAERLSRVGRLSAADTLKIITHASRALTRAHDAGIIHRDLKPGNLFIVHNEDDEIVKVLDFGLAKWRVEPEGQHAAATVTGQLLGTPYYMSPEQVEASNQVDYRSDLWSLGVITYQCLVGARPFEGESLLSLALQICERKPAPIPEGLNLPIGLNGWLERALAKSKAARFQSARELADELRRVFGASPASVRTDSSSELNAARVGHRLAQSAPSDGRAPVDARPGQGTVDMGRSPVAGAQHAAEIEADPPPQRAPAPAFEDTVEAVVDYAAALGRRAEVLDSDSASRKVAQEADSVEAPPSGEQSVLPVARSTSRVVKAPAKRPMRMSAVLTGFVVAAIGGMAALSLRGQRGASSGDAAAARLASAGSHSDTQGSSAPPSMPTPIASEAPATTSTTELPSEPPAALAGTEPPREAASTSVAVAEAAAPPLPASAAAKTVSSAPSTLPKAPSLAPQPTSATAQKVPAVPKAKARGIGQSKVWLERE